MYRYRRLRSLQIRQIREPVIELEALPLILVLPVLLYCCTGMVRVPYGTCTISSTWIEKMENRTRIVPYSSTKILDIFFFLRIVPLAIPYILLYVGSSYILVGDSDNLSQKFWVLMWELTWELEALPLSKLKITRSSNAFLHFRSCRVRWQIFTAQNLTS